MAIMSEFAPEPNVRVIGSEIRDLAEGREELEAHIRYYFGLPVRLVWQWRRREVSSVGNVAWLFAEGELVFRGENSETRVPYRLTGVLERRDGGWRWRHFHGAEPRPDR